VILGRLKTIAQGDQSSAEIREIADISCALAQGPYVWAEILRMAEPNRAQALTFG
jgi:hypothetical protein